MNNFWNYESLDQLHIELTNACNAACPMCVRFHKASPLIRPDLTIGQITLEKFKQWIPPEVLKQIKIILFCGVHGDPCVARDFLEICQYISDNMEYTEVHVNTNGGMRTPDWWKKVGTLFNKNKGNRWHFTFSIDGLQNTNHLYRRNVVWGKLIANVKAYNSQGATSIWDYLVFEHNEHQIKKARKMSKKLGFTHFLTKKSLGVDNGTSLKGMPALDKEGNLDYWIEAPKNKEYRNLQNPIGDTEYKHYPFDVSEYRKLKKNKENDYNLWDVAVTNVYPNELEEANYETQDNCKIYCKSQNVRENGDLKKEVFIDSSGIVMPCCYMGTHLVGRYTWPETMQLHNHMNKHGWESFDLHKHTLKQILQGNHLNKVFADSWDIDKIANGKTLFCANTCGKVSAIDAIFSHPSIKTDKFVNKRVEIEEWHRKNNV